ncbi:MAG: hypothetical protein MRZ74_11020 [Blautia sp.]|nr:hypothetical protein [Blautia sp.]MDY5031317.1 hypothetical protein [Blautia sp.]
MKRQIIDGENWYTGSMTEKGDLLVVTGFPCEWEPVLLVEGNSLKNGLYHILIESVSECKAAGIRLRLCLNIPFFVQKSVQEKLEKYDIIDETILKCESEFVSETEDGEVFAEKIIIDDGFGNNFFVVSQGRILQGTTAALTEYLKERFGE